MLTKAHKNQRMTAARKFLNQYHAKGYNYLKHIVMQMNIGSQKPDNNRCNKNISHHLNQKIQANTCWQEDYGYSFLRPPRCFTCIIPGTSYDNEFWSVLSNTRKMRRGIQNHQGTVSSDVVLLHNNAWPPSAVATRVTLRYIKWNVFYHPSYCPDLAPSDFCVFMHLKNSLVSQKFINVDELKSTVDGWLKKQAVNLFEEGTKKLVRCYNKHLYNDCSYVEK